MNNILITVAFLILFIILFIILTFFITKNYQINESRNNENHTYRNPKPEPEPKPASNNYLLPLSNPIKLLDNFNKWNREGTFSRYIHDHFKRFIYFIIRETKYWNNNDGTLIENRYKTSMKNLNFNPFIGKMDGERWWEESNKIANMKKENYNILEILLSSNLFLNELIFTIGPNPETMPRTNNSFIKKIIGCLQKHEYLSDNVKYYLLNFLNGWYCYINYKVISICIRMREVELDNYNFKNKKGDVIKSELSKYQDTLNDFIDEYNDGFRWDDTFSFLLPTTSGQLRELIEKQRIKIEDRKLKLKKEIPILKKYLEEIYVKYVNEYKLYMDYKRKSKVITNKLYKSLDVIDQTFEGIDYYMTPLNVFETIGNDSRIGIDIILLSENIQNKIKNWDDIVDPCFSIYR